jgi:hypothetical protein
VAILTARIRRTGLSTAIYEAGERRRVAWMSAVAVGASVLLGQAVIRVGPVAILIPIAILVLAAVTWKPRVGLYVMLALVLMFEVGGPDPLMLPGHYFHYGLQSSLGVSGFIASPLELLMVLVLVVWLVPGLVRGNLDYRGGDLGWPIGLFFVAILLGIVRGAGGGGDTYIAFWEARSLLYFGICYLLTANLIRTRRDVAVLVGIFLFANGVYAIEGAYRDLLLIRTGLLDVPQEFSYSHEVVIFLSVLVLQVLIQLIVKAPLWLRIAGVLLAPIGFYTLLATHRRAGYIALALAFVIMAIPWVVRHRKAMLLVFVPGVIVMAVYLPVFWNNTGVFGQPARAVRSLYEPDERDASSNDYRDLEKINVQETILADPLLGVGFGQPFQFVVPLPDLSWWPFWHFEPHHNILWVWLKTGALGFTVFWVMMMGALAIAGSRVLTLSDPTLITFAYLALASIVITLVFSYVDLGLTNGRVTMFLGVVLGVLAVLRQIDAETVGAGAAEAGAAKLGATATARTIGGSANWTGPGAGRWPAGGTSWNSPSWTTPGPPEPVSPGPAQSAPLREPEPVEAGRA